MVEAVMVFAILLALFEFTVLSMIPPRYRLRVLGSQAACMTIHVVMLVLNLWIHWGTVTGTMAATGSFVVSLLTVKVARMLYGTIVDDVRVQRGVFRYRNEELVL